jgi:CO/xanthine dehydrogenase Mo-binding subunit
MSANHAAVPVAAGPSVGQPIDMSGARARVDGSIGFALNATMPGMAHARLLRSPFAHARITHIDVSAAQNMPGVVGVLTAADFESAGAPARYFGPVLRDQPVLCGEKVRFAGDPVAAVAAETAEAADAALLAIEVEYEELPAVTTVDEALAADASLVHDRPPLPGAGGYADIKLHGREGNVCTKFQLRRGDVEAGFALADVIVEGVYESPVAQHVPMEPHVVLASFDGPRLTVISSTQGPYAVRDSLAEMFGLPSSYVRVIVPPLGGGYGAKTYPKFEPVTAALAWKVRRPVKLVLSREEEFVSVTKHAARVHMRTGATKDGRLVARDVRVDFNAGAYTDISPRLIKNGGYSCVGPYDIPHVRIDSYAVYTNLPPAGAYRGYGVSQTAWAYEQQMDELADDLGIDPVELRRRNLLTQGQQFATGEVMHEAHWEKLLDRTAAAIGWPGQRRSVPGNGRVRGKGLAVVLKSTITPSTSTASVRLDADGCLQVLTSSVEMGQGAHTVLAQLAADALGVPVAAVNVTTPDTQYTPYDQTTSSSRTTRAMGGAVTTATREVRAKLLKLAGELLEAAPGDLEFADGVISVRGDAQAKLSIPEVFLRSRSGSLHGDGAVITAGGLDPQTGQGIASDVWLQGAAGAEVEVDLATGKIYVRHVYAVAHAGRVVNPKLARLQMHGSVIFGMSHALHEELVFGDGVPVNPNLAEYAIMAMGDMPERLEVELLEDPGEARIHGLGETVLPPVIAAISNAVHSAVGRQIRRLPMTPERVLNALSPADDAGTTQP